jgi:hypothetical protein
MMMSFCDRLGGETTLLPSTLWVSLEEKFLGRPADWLVCIGTAPLPLLNDESTSLLMILDPLATERIG